MKRLIFLMILLHEAYSWRPKTNLLHKFWQHAAGKEHNYCDTDGCYPVDEMWFNSSRTDHFSYTADKRFGLRWVWNMTYYKDGGPIFFYTGNEGKLEGFITATGMIFDLAPLFNAAIIFAEHRFYGKTQPFGSDSYKNVNNMGYLTSEQALGDFADLLTELKRDNNSFGRTFPKDTPIISFGGSYGGMLSAWFRMKYPHIVKGAWAGSAPLIYFKGSGVDPGTFDNITSRTYVDAGCSRDMLAQSWKAILNLSSTASGRDWLNNHFIFNPNTTIQSVTDGWNLVYFFQEAVEYMAMTDYPYKTNFLMDLPAWPVNVACQYMNASPPYTDEQLVTAIGNVAAVYYNTSGNMSNYCINPDICGDQGTGGLGADQLGWPWQECSEIVMYMCTKGGDNDVFWDTCGKDPLNGLYDYCNQAFKPLGWTQSMMNVDGVSTLYGLNLNGASNIILTQGHLDPWSGGGYTANSPGVDQSKGLYVVEIPGSAHHLDLRTPNTCDPNTITNARYQIVNIIKCWVDPNCKQPPSWQQLPQLTIPNTECKDIINGYPWGQDVVPTSSSSATGSSGATTISTGSTTSKVTSHVYNILNLLVSFIVSAIIFVYC